MEKDINWEKDVIVRLVGAGRWGAKEKAYLDRQEEAFKEDGKDTGSDCPKTLPNGTQQTSRKVISCLVQEVTKKNPAGRMVAKEVFTN